MKKEFITAYVWFFHATKKEAAEAYKIANNGYIKAVIEAYKQNAKKAFNND